MKKILILSLLLLGILGLLLSCDGGTPSATETQDTLREDDVTSEESLGEDKEDVTENATSGDTTTSAGKDDVTDAEPEKGQPGRLIHASNDELRYLDNMGEVIGCAYEAGQYEGWTKRALTVGKNQVATLVDWGWAAFDSAEYTFGYIVNGDHFFSEIYAVEAEDAVRASATDMGAQNCSRYYGALTSEALRLGDNAVQFCVRLDGDVLCVLREYTVTVTEKPVKLDGTYWSVDIDTWTVSGHNPHIQDSSNGMVAAGGVDKGALLHQGAIGIGTIDLSKYSKVIVYFGCDASGVTQDRYNNNANNRIIIAGVDSHSKMSPDEKDIIAYSTYTLPGWTPVGVEIDLTGINYKGPVYVTLDFLPGTFALITAIEFLK